MPECYIPILLTLPSVPTLLNKSTGQQKQKFTDTNSILYIAKFDTKLVARRRGSNKAKDQLAGNQVDGKHLNQHDPSSHCTSSTDRWWQHCKPSTIHIAINTSHTNTHVFCYCQGVVRANQANQISTFPWLAALNSHKQANICKYTHNLEVSDARTRDQYNPFKTRE